MKVAIIGTVGVPANYGGFETLVENIVRQNRSDELEYSVYCSSKNYNERHWVYRGAKVVYVPLKANGIQSIFYDVFSVLHALRQADVLLVLGVSGCCILPFVRLLSRKRIIVNIDGLEHRRDKWNKWVRKFLKFSEALAVKYADVIVSDNKGIQDYVLEEYGKKSALIEYGGDHVICDTSGMEEEILGKYQLSENGYSLALCRIEPENNVEMILRAFVASGELLIFIGNWHNSEFGRRLKEEYETISNIKLLESIYDIKVLNVLRTYCKFYLHGHSAGGTNPSLVEAMYFGRPVLAFNVVYNRETTEGKAGYFGNEQDLIALMNEDGEEVWKRNGEAMREIAYRRYCWNVIANKYERLYLKN